ncbi:MAG: hypothetical protein ABIJ86_05875 [Spirochaetota bacterium]
MMIKSSARRTPSLLFALLIAFITTASLVSCEDLFNSIFDTAAPTSLKASDGKYANRIEVSWSAPDLSSEKWNGKSVDGYIVRWWGPENDSAEISAGLTSFTINVDPANRAKEYQIEVTTVVDGGEKGSSTDSGFALETFDLIWKDGGADYNFTGNDRWYVTMLQKGFRYDFTFREGETVWIQFYKYVSLDLIHETGVSGESNSLSWVCDENGDWHRFYVRVVPSTPGADFRASFGF